MYIESRNVNEFMQAFFCKRLTNNLEASLYDSKAFWKQVKLMAGNTGISNNVFIKDWFKNVKFFSVRFEQRS